MEEIVPVEKVVGTDQRYVVAEIVKVVPRPIEVAFLVLPWIKSSTVLPLGIRIVPLRTPSRRSDWVISANCLSPKHPEAGIPQTQVSQFVASTWMHLRERSQ